MTEAAAFPSLADLPPGSGPDAALSDDELVAELRSWSRLHAQVHARKLRVIAAVATRSVQASGVVDRDGGAMEVAAALTWTEGKAARELDFAVMLIERLPLVFSAFEAGDIDNGKAWMFADILGSAELTPDQLESICTALLAEAPGLTAGQLRVRLRRAVLAVDPAYAARRYRRAIEERRVCGYLAADGSGVITGRCLRADDTAAACERVDQLVKAISRAGHPAAHGQLAADVFVRLLDGRLHGMSVDQVIQTFLADPTTFPDESSTRPEPKPNEADPLRPGIEIRVGLATLLGRDDRPGEIAGFGPVLPDTARTTVARQRGAEWRFAILDPDGRLELAGVTRRRSASAVRAAYGGIVELHVTAEQLTDLAAEPERCGEWADVVADLARQYADRERLSRELDAHPERRFVRSALRRHIQVRDRTCCAPGCGRPAVACDVDHTREHRRGGPTVSANVGPGCRRHHPMKEVGWTLEQPEPGLFRWTSPLGQVYWTRGEPIMPPLLDSTPPTRPPPSDEPDEEPPF